jgi:hypothetical protein
MDDHLPLIAGLLSNKRATVFVLVGTAPSAGPEMVDGAQRIHPLG